MLGPLGVSEYEDRCPGLCPGLSTIVGDIAGPEAVQESLPGAVNANGRVRETLARFGQTQTGSGV